MLLRLQKKGSESVYIMLRHSSILHTLWHVKLLLLLFINIYLQQTLIKKKFEITDAKYSNGFSANFGQFRTKSQNAFIFIFDSYIQTLPVVP